ncbi:MAG TPA: transporter, partial [Phycisphaerae bacterium]|nr:transporter [Phycisphaerae bacterium]
MAALAIATFSSVAQAQTEREGEAGGAEQEGEEPMSLEEDSQTEIPPESGELEDIDDQDIDDEDGDDDGDDGCDDCDDNEFWFWPSPAPLKGKIATDRPGFSNTASLVPRGRVQFEGGYTFTYDREDDRRIYDHRMGEMALRTGLTDWLELRVGWAGFSATEFTERIRRPVGRMVTQERHEDGWHDMNLGVKVPLLREKKCLPNVSFIYEMSIPTGSSDKSTNDVGHFFSLPWNYAITKKITAFGSLTGT